MRRDVLNSPRLRAIHKKKHRATRKKALFFCLGAVAVFLFLGLGARAERLNIKNIEVEGNQTVSTGAIENFATDYISGNYFFIFPKTNFIIYPKNGIRDALSAEFKGLKDIVVSLENIDTLKITVSERIGEYVWCGEILPETGINSEDVKCYFIDNSGFIFDEAPYFSGDVYFRFFGTPKGGYFFRDIFQNLIFLKDYLVTLDLEPVKMFLKPDGDIEIYLVTSGGASPRILLSQDADLRQPAENLETALSTDPLRREFNERYSALEYIDLRFGNKVYYRFK